GILYCVVKNTVLVKFKEDFLSQHHPNCRYDVNFSFNREFLKRCHQAIDCAATNRSLVNFLFPNPTISSSSDMPTRNLKEKEAFAIDQVCRLVGAPPYLIEGSPSVTFGKISTTGTLIDEMVVVILRKNPSSRILMCAPTNDICDVLMRSLRRKISLSGLDILPANAAFMEIDGVPADNLSSCTNEGEGFTCLSLEELQNLRIIVSTYVSSFRLANEGLTSGHFSHIFMVDASLATEPETMVMLANFVAEKTVVVVTGTERTFPTWLRSDIGRKYGLQKSYFQRIFERKQYSSLCPNLVIRISEYGKE
ncbi:Helicase mov-10, partial [Thalictrum thalictroides]